MPAILIAALISIVAGFVTLGMVITSPYATGVNEPVAQPVPFSHEHHVAALGLDCRYCHTSVEKSAFAGIPPTETCMTCHSQVWTDAPALEPIRASWRNETRLEWNRVHDLPDYTYFNHSAHVNKGVACIECHGSVDEMPLVWQSETLFMKWCLECHRHPETAVGPMPDVYKTANAEPVDSEQGLQRLLERQIQPSRLSDCSICHR